jgi:hypothetical protein
MIRNFFAIVLLLISASALASFGGLHGTSSTAAYVGPCDVGSVSCGEAHSVTRAMKASYNGPLFQLNNGTTTLDIGQDPVTRKTDMTTWSAFCSGVASNCKISKIYGQINGNDLIPSVYFSGGCNAGGLTCAATFVVDGATGLPIIKAGYQTDAAWKAEYTLAGDNGPNFAVGINGGTNPTSVWVSGEVPPSDAVPCCGVYGISHGVLDPNTAGTDFLLFTGYTNNYPPDTASCTSGHCLGADVEAFISPTSSYTATNGDNANYLVTWSGTAGAGTNTFCNYYNGSQLGCALATTAGQNTPTHIHFGGGGDLTQPAKVIFRSGFIANGVVSSTDAATIKSNEASFYGITFN